LCSLATRNDNHIPTRFLAPIDCLKFQHVRAGTTTLFLTRFQAPMEFFKNSSTVQFSVQCAMMDFT
jgi:hypothetical protein